LTVIDSIIELLSEAAGEFECDDEVEKVSVVDSDSVIVFVDDCSPDREAAETVKLVVRENEVDRDWDVDFVDDGDLVSEVLSACVAEFTVTEELADNCVVCDKVFDAPVNATEAVIACVLEMDSVACTLCE
jgi:hypothetical protein